MGDPWPEYEITRNLGKGGSGSVDEVLLAGKACRKLALKTVSWDGKGNVDVLKSRALKEMAILKKLRHPCLPKLYGFKTTPHDAQILMTRAECGDLQQIQGVEGGLGFDEMQIKLCTAEVLLALEALHDNGIVYADLKPENVLMRPCGHVMLCDFDMSLLKSDLNAIRGSPELSANAETRCVGTLEFCAPEVITSGMLGYSDASDFWALGVLVYELASGRNPFSGHSAEQTISKVMSFTPRLGDAVDCSQELASFVHGLLRHNPEHRLGANGIDAIKGHAWFSDFDWDRHLRELMTGMAGVLWALSSILELDWKLLQPPAALPTRFSWLQEILSVHETVRQAVLHGKPGGLLHTSQFQDQALQVLSHGLAHGDLEEKCVAVACLGGLCEGFSLTGGKDYVVCSLAEFQKGLVLAGSNMAGTGTGGKLNKKLQASLGICVGRLYAFVGEELGYSLTCADCMLTALLDFILPLEGLMEGGNINSGAFGKEWLGMYEGSMLSQEVWRLTSVLAKLVPLMDRVDCSNSISRLSQFSRDFGDVYSTYIERSPKTYVDQLPGDLIKKAVGKSFLVVVRLLRLTFERVSADSEVVPAFSLIPIGAEPLMDVEEIKNHLVSGESLLTPLESAALLVLEAVGNLQFARVSSKEYVLLLQSVLGKLMSNGTTPRSLAMFASLFPDYDILVGPSIADGGLPVWRSDPMLISKVIFLMRLAPVVLNDFRETLENSCHLEGIASLIKSLAPFSFLLLHHEEELIRTAAHAFMEALIVSLGSRNFVDDVEELMPFYVDRSLDEKHLIPMAAFSSCFKRFVGLTSIDGVSLKYSLDRLASEILDEIPKAGLISDLGVSLFGLQCKVLVWVPMPLLTHCMGDSERVVLKEGGGKTMQVLCSMIGNSRDYTRKVDLAKFYLGLRGSMLASGTNLVCEFRKDAVNFE